MQTTKQRNPNRRLQSLLGLPYFVIFYLTLSNMEIRHKSLSRGQRCCLIAAFVTLLLQFVVAEEFAMTAALDYKMQPTVHKTHTDSEDPLFCFVVRTYWGHGDGSGAGLRRFLQSLQRQSYQRCGQAYIQCILYYSIKFTASIL